MKLIKNTPEGLTLTLSPKQSTRLAEAAREVGYTPAQFVNHVLAESMKSAQESARATECERPIAAPSNWRRRLIGVERHMGLQLRVGWLGLLAL